MASIFFKENLFYDVLNIKLRLLRESVIPDNAEDEIWLKLNVFRNVRINLIGDATFYNWNIQTWKLQIQIQIQESRV